MKIINQLMLIGTMLVSGVAFAQQTPESLAGVNLVSAKNAQKMQESGKALLVNTRVAVEFSEKSAKGAVNIVYREKSAKDVKFDRTQDKFDLDKLPKDKTFPVIFFCNAGECWKSYKAAVLAVDAEYKNVYWMRGGMPEWVAAGLPTQ